MRFFFHIGYHGINYHGWQRQLFTEALKKMEPDPLTVQEVIEGCLGKIVKTPVTIFGCGRTDAQVHASQYFFHMDVEQEWDFDLRFRLNKILPGDIAIFDSIKMEGSPHARWDATQRTYDYFIHTYKDPFLNNFSAFYPEKELNLDAMAQAVSLLVRYNDYRAFCKSPNKYEHTICHVSSAKIFADGNGDKLRFQISSNRFLHRMIRILVGKLLKIGRNELSVSEFESYLVTKQTPATIIPAHPQGLYLSKVTYPFLDIPPRTQFSSILQNKDDVVWEEV